MVKYCKLCRSLIIGESCTNYKCKNHIKNTEAATREQTGYIENMLEKLGEDCEYNFVTMSRREADKIIVKLEERLELGE